MHFGDWIIKQHYEIFQMPLQEPEEKRDLRVTMSSDKCTKQCLAAYNKPITKLGFVAKMQDIILALYTAPVRPHLE